MNDLIGLHARLEHIYGMYVESAFPLRDADLRRERQALLAQPGMLAQPPLVEPVTQYASSGLTLTGAAARLPGGANDVAQLAAPLLPASAPLYAHQVEALEQSILHGRDLVITTGTGSGKTEAFLLPLLASLARESAGWSAPHLPSAGREWWRTGETRPEDPARSQWGHVTRPAAVRALVLYPLNALVEDQLRRLRTVLNAPQVLEWLDQSRRGNRVTFGRYTGLTPVPGRPTGKAGQRNMKRLLEHLLSLDRQAQALVGLDDPEVRHHFPDLSGGEAWSRWDMQVTPPDLLITNYSMLNIMLMREVEAPIFSKTRAWLEADPSNVFHLIVDELHAYRGTPGTEVSFIVRLLLTRLGLRPDSPQLRIIATTASLEDNSAGRAFLTEFFGRPPEHFHFITGQEARPPAHLPSASPPDLAAALETFARDVQADPLTPLNPQTPPDPALHRLAQALGGEPCEDAHVHLAAGLEAAGLPALVREACRDENGTVRATRTAVLTARLFPGRPEALRGALMALSLARHADGRPILPVRGHLFFQNVRTSGPVPTRNASLTGRLQSPLAACTTSTDWPASAAVACLT